MALFDYFSLSILFIDLNEVLKFLLVVVLFKFVEDLSQIFGIFYLVASNLPLIFEVDRLLFIILMILA